MGVILSYISTPISHNDLVTPRLEQDITNLCANKEKASLWTSLSAALAGEDVADGAPLLDRVSSAWHRRELLLPNVLDTFWHGAKGVPLAIVRPETEAEVAATLRAIGGCKALRDVPISVAGGRHSHQCMVTDSIVIDLSAFTDITVDKGNGVVCVGGGSRLADVDAATAGTGWAVPTGTNGDTGVGGLTLAGGWGWLARKHGLSADCVITYRLAKADGTIVDVPRHSDLGWALAGGGGNFGIVLRFTFQAVPLPNKPLKGEVVYFAPTQASAAVILAGGDVLVRSEPFDDVGIVFALPCGAPVVPTLWLKYSDSQELTSLADVPELMPATELGGWFRVANEWKAVDHYTTVQSMLAAVQSPGYIYEVALSITEMTPAVIDVLLGATRDWYPNKESSIVVAALGGAIGRVPEEEAALCHRAATYWLIVEGRWSSPDDEAGAQAARAWAQRLRSELRETGELLETPHTAVDSRAAAAYTPQKLARLRALKAQHDPENLFRLNRNIEPAA
jgi:FAD/FMN-containing dehydrogenase